MSTTLSNCYSMIVVDTIQDLLAPHALIPPAQVMIKLKANGNLGVHTTIMWILKDNINLKTHTTIMWMLQNSHRHKEMHLRLLKAPLTMKKDKATLKTTSCLSKNVRVKGS